MKEGDLQITMNIGNRHLINIAQKNFCLFKFTREEVYIWALRIAIAALAVSYVYAIGVGNILHIYAQIDQEQFWAGLAVISSVNILRPLRTIFLLRKLDSGASFWCIHRISMESFFLSLLTPGRLGDFYKSLRFRTLGVEEGSSYLTFLLERVMDILFLVVLITFSCPFDSTNYLRGTFVVVIALLLLTFYCFSRVKRLKNTFKWICVSPFKPIRWLINTLTLAQEAFKRLGHRVISWLCVINAMLWFILLVGFYLLFGALSVNLPLDGFLTCVSLAFVAQVIPISFFGLGTRESVLIAYLSGFGIDSTQSIAVSGLFLTAMVCALMISSPFWLFKYRHDALRGSEWNS